MGLPRSRPRGTVSRQQLARLHPLLHERHHVAVRANAAEAEEAGKEHCEVPCRHPPGRPGIEQLRQLAEGLTLHQDLHAGAAGRKLAGSVLVMHFTHHRVAMPRARGTLGAFAGWTLHEVTPVTRGERWALIVNGFGPPLR